MKRRGKLAHILHAVYCEPWLIRPEMHLRIQEIVEAHVTGDAHKPDGIVALFGDAPTQEDVFRVTPDGVGVLEISGVIGKRVGELERMSGVTDLDDLSDALAAAAEDPAIRGIVLNIDSPGGTVSGVPEFAEQVAAAGDAKRIVAYTDTMAASAAYWIGARAWAFVAAPSAEVGSVGVYMPVLDQSAAYAANGLRREVIKSGKYKGAGVPGTSLTEEQRAHFQARVDDVHARFKAAVRAGRGNVPDAAMEGQGMFADEAREYGMIDMLGDFKSALKLAQG